MKYLHKKTNTNLLVYIGFMILLNMSLFAVTGKEIIERSGIKGGVVIHINCNDPLPSFLNFIPDK